jgi:hypothetical protein
LLKAQILVLSLMPVFSGGAPQDCMWISPLTLLGVEQSISADFLAGSWKVSDEFAKWGITDKERSTISEFRGSASMTLRKDGTLKMVNLFKPEEGRWEAHGNTIIISDPRFPERGSQLVPVRRRDQNRIWLILPFTGGSAGIGMVRVKEDDLNLAGKHLQEPKKAQAAAPKEARPRGFWNEPKESKPDRFFDNAPLQQEKNYNQPF